MSTPIAAPGVEHVLSDPAASHWLKAAVRDSMERDPTDALNDALALAGVLEERLRQVMGLEDPV